MTEPTNAKQRKMLQRLFAHPTPNDILWADILSLLRHLGYTIETRRGSAYSFQKGIGLPLVEHGPHPSRQTHQDSVRRIRKFLEKNGDAP
jgi:hypothetical protein